MTNHSNEELKFISKLKLLLPSIETISLSTHLISSQSLTKWFDSLEKLIRYSLAKLVFQLYENKLNEQLDQFLSKQTIPINQQEYPLQVLLLVEHLLFGQILRKQIEKKDKLTIRNSKYTTLFLHEKCQTKNLLENLDTNSKIKSMH